MMVEITGSPYGRLERGPVSRLILSGKWNLDSLDEHNHFLSSLPPSSGNEIVLDGAGLEALDTAGAFSIVDYLGLKLGKRLLLEAFSPEHSQIVELVQKRLIPERIPEKKKKLGLVAVVGRAAITVGMSVVKLVVFIGQVASSVLDLIIRPRLFRARELFVQLEAATVDAIPIVSLVSFLIGFVITYVFSSQTARFGGNMFIVEALSIFMCREFSPLIVAILMAGRSGSSYTAQIGTMKMNEEVDAMRTLGLSPFQVLVIPRVLALMIAMPLLVFVSDIVGLVAGMVVTSTYVGITSTTFMERVQHMRTLTSFLVGVVKAPVFALFIGMIGCQLGFAAEDNARSVGTNTTSSVVQGIVWMIILDAVFAVVLIQLGI